MLPRLKATPYLYSKKTYPAELYDAAFARLPTAQQIPAEFVQRFIHLSRDEYRQEMFDPARFPRPNPFNPIHLFQQYAVTAQGYTAIAEDLLESRGYDLFLLYFEQIDSFSHLFMKYAPPKLEWVDEQGFDRYRDLVTELPRLKATPYLSEPVPCCSLRFSP